MCSGGFLHTSLNPLGNGSTLHPPVVVVVVVPLLSLHFQRQLQIKGKEWLHRSGGCDGRLLCGTPHNSWHSRMGKRVIQMTKLMCPGSIGKHRECHFVWRMVQGSARWSHGETVDPFARRSLYRLFIIYWAALHTANILSFRQQHNKVCVYLYRTMMMMAMMMMTRKCIACVRVSAR